MVFSFRKTAPVHLLLKAVIILAHGLRMGEVNLCISSLTEVKRKGAMPHSQSPARIKETSYHIGGDVLLPIQPQLHIFLRDSAVTYFYRDSVGIKIIYDCVVLPTMELKDKLLENHA